MADGSSRRRLGRGDVAGDAGAEGNGGGEFCGRVGGRGWQFPQGGVDDGEDLLVAAKRELHEETGVRSTRLLGRTEEWVHYDFPPDSEGAKAAKGWKGQKQIWFALRFDGRESEIDLNGDVFAEFDAWRWGKLASAPDLVVPFKRNAYEHVVRAFIKFS